MMSSTSWRRWLNQRTLPTQGQRPIRRRRSAGSWEECEARTLLSVTIGDVTMIQPSSGTTDAVFTVTLSPANPDQIATVNYRTVDGSAKAGSDFQPVSGTLSFSPGETSKTIAVPIVGDTSSEPQESFSIQLSDPV